MGRVTKNSMRGRLQNTMTQLRVRCRVFLKDNDLQKAFVELWLIRSNEQGAMIYAGVLSAFDLILTSTVDNRKKISELQRKNRDTMRLIQELLEEIKNES